MKPTRKRCKSVSKSKIVPSTILSMGHYDINYSIELTDDDLSKFQIENITQLKTYEDISFIINNQYLWNKIKIETENKIINLLLYLNKITTEANKSYIEYISYETPIYYNESVKEMLKTANDFNFFFVNDYPISLESKKYFYLKIKNHNQEVIINFDKIGNNDENNIKDNTEDKKENNEKDLKEEKNDSNEIKVNIEESNENNNNEEIKNNANENNIGENKENKIEENKENQNSEKHEYLKNEKNVFNKIKLDCVNYNHFICSIEDTLEIAPYEDFIEFIIYVKLTCGARITIEYGDVSEYFNDKDSMALLNKIYLLTDIFLFDENDTINNFKKHYEIFSKNNNKKKYQINENMIKKDNEDIKIIKKIDETNKSQNKSQIDIIKKIENNSNILSNRSRENTLNINMTEKDLFDYFKHTIACNGALSIINNKLGIFIDNYFTKVTFIEIPMNIKATTLSYEIKPYPKLSHTTVDIVKYYKDKLRYHKDFFKSIFYAGILNKIFLCKKKSIGLEILYSSYLTGLEILKRMLHLIINEISLPDNQKFYIVKINKDDVNDYVKKEYYNKKENKFVLDCTNLEKSKLKYYVPLFDYNLNEFFGNKLIRKELANKGFINSKGFINYDPLYMKEIGISRNKIIQNSKSVNQNNILNNQIQVNSKKRILNNMPSMKIKLPAIQSRIKK